jgi:hypothetical protein
LVIICGFHNFGFHDGKIHQKGFFVFHEILDIISLKMMEFHIVSLDTPVFEKIWKFIIFDGSIFHIS